MTPRPRPRNGFTLVEVVVVIALIVLLSGLVLGVGIAVVKSAESRTTTLLLTQLDTAAKESRLQRDREITYGPGVPPYELHQLPQDDDLTAETLTQEYFAIVGRASAVRDLLAKVNGELVKRVMVGDPPIESLSFIDAWDHAVFVVLPGREWVQGTDPPADRDLDGTIRTPLEKRLGFARNRATFFVSSGPDGRFGSVDPTSSDLEASKDNIYSQKPELPVPP